MYWPSYALWWLQAGNSHGLHSPFAYQLYTHWLRKKDRSLLANAQSGLKALGVETICLSPIRKSIPRELAPTTNGAWLVTDIRLTQTHYQIYQTQVADPQWQLVIDLGTTAILIAYPGLSRQYLRLNPKKHNWF